jgi:hypothetical protein
VLCCRYTTPYQTLGDYVGFLWGEITTREYWWSRDAEKAKLVKTLTCSDLAGKALQLWTKHATLRRRRAL